MEMTWAKINAFWEKYGNDAPKNGNHGHTHAQNDDLTAHFSLDGCEWMCVWLTESYKQGTRLQRRIWAWE